MLRPWRRSGGPGRGGVLPRCCCRCRGPLGRPVAGPVDLPGGRAASGAALPRFERPSIGAKFLAAVGIVAEVAPTTTAAVGVAARAGFDAGLGA